MQACVRSRKIIVTLFSFIICCRQKRNANDVANVLGAKRRTIVVIVHRAATTKVIRFVSNGAVKS